MQTKVAKHSTATSRGGSQKSVTVCCSRNEYNEYHSSAENVSEVSGEDRVRNTQSLSDAESIEDGTTLINNTSAQALSVAEQARLDIQRCLQELGIRVNMEHVGTARERQSFQDGMNSLMSECSLTRGQDRGSRRSSMNLPQDPYVPDKEEQALLQSLFNDGTSRYVVKDEHMVLGRVMHSIFCHDGRADDTQTTDHFTSLSCPQQIFDTVDRKLKSCAPWVKLRAAAKKVINNSLVSVFFLVLTLYSLFSLDLVILFGSKEIGETFLIVGSCVFILFFIELVLWVLGVQGYVYTLPFVLDVVALVSVYNDTWFMRKESLFSDNDQASRLSRMARTSKMTRLARIVRVARITKLIPEMLRVLRKQNTVLAKQVLRRRLWRVFLYLDTDEDGLLSAFDVKVFYIAVIQECPHLLFSTRLDILRRDCPKLLEAMCFTEDTEPLVDFESFTQIVDQSELGRNLVKFHLDEVEQETGVWTLTQRLTDRTAMKVCVGILVLITMISFLEILPEDQSVLTTLAQLTAIAREEHTGGALDTSYLCRQIEQYVQRMWDPHRHEVLFLYLDGHVHYDASKGGCLSTPDSTTDPLARSMEIRQLSSSRESDFTWICWPTLCDATLVSASLVDQSYQEKDHSKWAVITIVMVILLLLIFVYVLNKKIRIFSGKLLQPLHSLVDDMTAMSCLELVHLDKEMPAANHHKPVEVAEELEHLQQVFKNMRSAIRS